MNHTLLPEEQEIENNIDNFKPVSAEKKDRINSLIDKAKKNKAISLRIADYDLGKLKEKAAKDGIPYQTLITSILHKYISNQLMEKEEMVKVVRALQSTKN